MIHSSVRTYFTRLIIVIVSLIISASSAIAWTQKGGTLSADKGGWAYHPAITTASDGTLYAAWTQHRNPAVWELAGTYVKRWVNGSWQPLGGRIGHTSAEAATPEGYAPSITVLGDTPYVAWYEGGGYGWKGTLRTAVFVAHWNGSQWVYDTNTLVSNGALNTSGDVHARDPVLATVDGVLYCAWVELRGKYNVVVVKYLSNGQWIQAGTEFSASTVIGSRIINVALADVKGSPHVAWTEWTRITPTSSPLTNNPGTVRVYQFSSGKWTAVGGPLNVSTQNYVTYVSLAAQGATPYVAWQERSATGNNKIYVKHWSGSTWVADGGSLNTNTTTGQAGRPTLASDGSRVWLAWTEGPPGQKSQLYVRSLSGSTWSVPDGSLNVNAAQGSAGHPQLTVSAGAPQVIWAEKHFPSSTKQVYVKGLDTLGVPSSDSLVPFGEDGPTVSIPSNTWVPLTPRGIAVGSNGVGDEAFNSFLYAPGIKKAVVFGKYHAFGESSGEDQNALLGYDFQANRWDLIEITESAWSEQLPGVGHDESNVVIDTVRDLYVTKGNLTLNNGTAWHTYVYDLKAGRGMRMFPTIESPLTGQVASAFDPEHDLMLSYGGAGSRDSWLYDYKTNMWTPVSPAPSVRYYPGMVYDSVNHVFVMFGGSMNNAPSNETWTFNPVTRKWTQQFPTVSPPGKFSPYLAFDSTNGVTLMMGGKSTEVWVYNAATNMWTQLADAPASATRYGSGANLTYNSDAKVFLLYSGTSLWDIWAFKYDPLAPPGAPAPASAPPRSSGSNVQLPSAPSGLKAEP